MTQTKFSLADVFTLLVALAFGFVCFLGINFHLLGEISGSIIYAAGITLALFFTSFGAKLLKRTSKGNFNVNFALEIVMVVLFSGILLVATWLPFSHYFAVSRQQTEITNNLNTSITQAKNMFAEYERYAENRIEFYERSLRRVVDAKYDRPSEYLEFGFDGSQDDEMQIRNKLFEIRAVLFPTNYEEIQEVAHIWLSNAQTTVNNWKPIGLANVVSQIDEQTNRWLNELIQISSQRQHGERTENFTYTLSVADVKSYFQTWQTPTPLGIALAVVAYILMLLSYFISGRSTKTSINKKTGEGQYDLTS